MAIIRLKRIATDFNSNDHKLLPGELGITGKSLLYGSMFEVPDGNGKVSARQVATQNFDNLFTATNTFRSDGQSISLQNAAGTEMYGVYGGRLVAMHPTGFAFNANDLVDRSYVDAAAQGLSAHAAVIVATTAEITISSAPASIDGVTLESGNRVLVKNQSTALQNGIYVFNGPGVAMTRATDMDGS